LAAFEAPENPEGSEAARIDARSSGGHPRTGLEYRFELGTTIGNVDVM